MIKIRIYGTEAETATVVALLRTVLRVRSVSRPYRNRNAARPAEVRVYLDVELPAGDQ